MRSNGGMGRERRVPEREESQSEKLYKSQCLMPHHHHAPPPTMGGTGLYMTALTTLGRFVYLSR